MDPHQMTHGSDASRSMFKRVLAAMSIVTMAMTVPQVWIIWVNHQAAGVSVASWSAYLASALLWFGHGLRERDRNIYVACIGWIALDIAVIAGAWIYG